MHLRELGFTYSACGPFTRNRQRIQTIMQAGDTNYIYKFFFSVWVFFHEHS